MRTNEKVYWTVTAAMFAAAFLIVWGTADKPAPPQSPLPPTVTLPDMPPPADPPTVEKKKTLPECIFNDVGEPFACVYYDRKLTKVFVAPDMTVLIKPYETPQVYMIQKGSGNAE